MLEKAVMVTKTTLPPGATASKHYHSLGLNITKNPFQKTSKAFKRASQIAKNGPKIANIRPSRPLYGPTGMGQGGGRGGRSWKRLL